MFEVFVKKAGDKKFGVRRYGRRVWVGGGGRVGGGGGGGSGCRGGGGWLVAILGVGGDVGYGECEPRIEGIVQCTKRYCTILRKLKKMWGWVWGRGNI